jgi:uncharacterized damage-inducible protein DinB
MHQEIEKHWTRLGRAKEYYDAVLKVFSPEQLHFKPDANSWSMMEVMQHLYTSEQLSATFISNFDFNRKNEKLGLMSELKTILLVNRLNSKKKFKAPKVLIENKDTFNLSDDPHTFQHEWDELRNEMKGLMENYPEEKLSYFTFYQPVIGKITLSQTLQFFKAHLKHHEHQIEAINHDKNFPT